MVEASKTDSQLDGGTVDSLPQDAGLDAVDRKILGFIQSGFPLEKRPYAIIGEQAGVSEEEALERVRKLKERKIIRRIGANFNSRKLDFHSTLCAAKVPQDKLDAFVADVNSHRGVTHNYLRDHEYNIWFTAIGESREAVAELLAGITGRTGVPILNLPAEQVYKIKVDFQMD